MEDQGSIIKATDPKGDPTENKPLYNNKNTLGARDLYKKKGYKS